MMCVARKKHRVKRCIFLLFSNEPGLYLCKMIAQAHNGSLEIESNIGTGTRVVVKLALTNNTLPDKRTEKNT